MRNFTVIVNSGNVTKMERIGSIGKNSWYIFEVKRSLIILIDINYCSFFCGTAFLKVETPLTLWGFCVSSQFCDFVGGGRWSMGGR